MSMRLAVAAGVMLLAAPASAQTDSSAIRNAVTIKAIRAHQQALADIATDNGGSRVSGSAGYDASAEYVAEQLRQAGYQVTVQPFHFLNFEETAAPQLELVSPDAKTFAAGADFVTMRNSGAGTVEGIVIPTVDLVIPPSTDPSSTSGCEPEDFPAPPDSPAIALVQRGTCTFQTKVDNAAAAGYAAVLVFNEGQPGRQDATTGSLATPVSIPSVTTSFAVGDELQALAQAGEVRARVAVTATTQSVTTANVIGESPQGDPERVVVAGAHLDSVGEGPGNNDNGSGTAVLLEIALRLAEQGGPPVNKLRFGFWGAEEWGLLGSQHYVEQLTPEDLARIVLNLNFDMLGSPNAVNFVYDGDGSDSQPAGPDGSAEIEAVFLDYFAGASLPTRPSAFDGRSDYGPFIARGIPAGGLFSGAEDLKSESEAADFGGTAGMAYDPCYHKACDDIANADEATLEALAGAAAHAVWHYANEVPAPAMLAASTRSVGRSAGAVPLEAMLLRGGGHYQR
ncbi:M28 family peptidase [Paracoccus marinaquae]|uniref:M28 family peptidase n=1 Tax=Paracoccus marinaquae TaxID=2841926 RepID=A0ABS6ALG3_9RHOB|nr:M20/M25/M40 family metallo-hydrolase [Paracoccus marinaquae]MBU3031413.1 M28 family peptidase [Paracoccus marinaquae]